MSTGNGVLTLRRTQRGNRTLNSLALAAGALALGLIGLDLLARFLPAPSPTDGLLALVGAGLLFALAVLRSPPQAGTRWAPAPDAGLGQEGRSVTKDQLRWLLASTLLLLAGAMVFLSLVWFREQVRPSLRWALYVAATAPFVGAVYLLDPGVGRKHSRRPQRRIEQRWTWLALAGILIVAAFFRLYRFKELPYGLWYDEADNGLWARRILADPSFRPIYVSSTNLPAHFLYLVAGAFRLLGDSMHAIRAVAVLFGLLTVLAAYYCGREVGGPAIGLCLAALLAVSRWDVNWSRIGMHGVTVPFFELWVMAALLRGLRTRRLTAFGWAGLALGIGLCFYSPFRAFPAVVAGFVLVWGVRWLVRLQHAHPEWSAARFVRQIWASWGVPALLFVLGAALATAPVLDYAQREPDLFWDRAKKVSILASPEAEADPVRAVLDSAVKHLLMFHYRGDPNGRHNLPSAPMLARMSGILMVFGLVLCLLRLSDPTSVLLLLWFLIPLSGGIMSTWFEAPQSLRSIGSLPAVYLLACLPMAWFAGEWARVFPQPGVRRRLALLALFVLGAIAVENGVTYFQVWGHDFASWAAFNPAETHLAQDINRYRLDYELRFDPLLTAHLATRYLAPDYEVYHHFDPATVFPLRGTSQQGIMLFIAPDTYSVRDLARELYPGVFIETFGHPDSDRIVLHKYLFTREEIASVQGLDVRYVSLDDPDRVEHRVKGLIDLDWKDESPVPLPLAATWTGGLLAPRYGVYRLQVELPGAFTLGLDGQPVLYGEGFAGRDLVLAQGTHSLYLDAEITDLGAVRFSWRAPGEEDLNPVPGDVLYRAFWPVRGLLGRYYANAAWEGEPALVRIDRQIGYYFHYLPLPRPYTVEWSGQLYVPLAGPYRFRLNAVGEATLFIDGELVFDSAVGSVAPQPLVLSAGLHDLQIRFLDDRSHSQIYLYWEPPDGDPELIPSDALYPPQAGAWWPAP